ncbi:MAG: 50S ribosomal protein L29 [Deltaproteobacteria bacterium]|nr:50S ribosomal protein L29 [Deltaproteobacteria bacterium]
MKIGEIRERSDGELKSLGRQLLDDLYKLRVQKSTNQLENTSSLRLVRRDLARVMTVVRARGLGLEASKKDQG